MQASSSTIRLAVVALASVCLRSSAVQDDVTGPDNATPNILVIVADDMPNDALGLLGNQFVRTPNLDELARGGAIMTRMYVPTGQCAPSRAALLTGRLPHRTGVAQNGDGLRLDQPLLPRLLQERGYYTAIVGKCHLGADPTYERADVEPAETIDPDPHAAAMGFEHRVVFFPDRGFLADFYQYDLSVDGDVEQLEGRRAYATDELTTRAMRTIERSARMGRPFFVWLAYNAPHQPLTDRNRPPEHRFGSSSRLGPSDVPITTAEDRNPRSRPLPHRQSKAYREWRGMDVRHAQHEVRNMYEMIEGIDRNVGRLLGQLERQRIERNTVVVFLSDNGVMLGDHEMYGKGPTFFEDQVRVPFLIRYPAVIASGTKSDALASTIDFMATLLELVGAPQPSEIDGQSFAPVLRGDSEQHRESAFLEYFGTPGEDPAPMRGVVWDRYKLILHIPRSARGPEYELYDLSRDADEVMNLVSRKRDGAHVVHPGAEAAFDVGMRHLLEWQKATGDPMLEDVRAAAER